MKKITLLLTVFFALQNVVSQNSCATPTAINSAGYYIVGFLDGAATTAICTPNGTNDNPTAEWYSYTPSDDYTVTITTSISENTPLVDTRFQVYTGNCGALLCHGGDDDSGTNLSSVGTFNVTANTTYIIAFDNRWTPSGFTFQLVESPIIVTPPSPVTFVGQFINTINSSINDCAVDMNGDYLDDIVGVNPSNLRIHFQNPDGSFTMSDIITDPAVFMPSWSIAAGDYNKDGMNDLLYGSGSGLTLMGSNDTGTYNQITPGQYIFCQRTNFADINNDGNLDAFSCHDVAPNVYYLNDGAGNFTYYQSGVTPGAYMLGPIGGNYASMWTDYDNDGDSDLFISKCSGPPCELHRNDGGGVFTNVAPMTNLAFSPVQSWSSAVFDMDNDGDMDILIGSNGGVRSKLFRNNLDTTNSVEEPFTDITTGSGWDTDTSTYRDYIAYDFDNDGFVDVMGGGNKIMYNQGNGTFAPVPVPFSVGAVADFNNDGFLDVQNGAAIFKSQGNANKWLKINLLGIQSNSNGIGARVEIHGAWGIQIRDVRSGEGFGYMSTLNVHFGIGTASAIEKVVIKWPSGIVDVILNPSSNQSIFVTEGSSPLATDQFTNSSFSIYPNPANDVLHIQSNQSVEFKNAAIYDLSGRRIITKELLTNSIDVKSLSVGTYILVLKDKEGNQFSEKFVKK